MIGAMFRRWWGEPPRSRYMLLQGIARPVPAGNDRAAAERRAIYAAATLPFGAPKVRVIDTDNGDTVIFETLAPWTPPQ